MHNMEQTKVLALVGGLISVVGLLIAMHSISTNYKAERETTKIELMKLCLAEKEPFENCKFLVYGGIRITRNPSTVGTE